MSRSLPGSQGEEEMQQERRDFFMWPDATEGQEGFQRTRCKGPECPVFILW